MANDKDKGGTPPMKVETPAAPISIDSAQFAQMIAEGIKLGLIEMKKAELEANKVANEQLSREERVRQEIEAEKRSPCPLCFQPKKACGYKEWKDEKTGALLSNDAQVHEMVSVLPERKEVIKWFQGIKINGVAYLSGWDGAPIKVPRNAAVKAMVRKFETNELEIMQGREAEHHSGSFGAGGPIQVNKATHAWRDS